MATTPGMRRRRERKPKKKKTGEEWVSLEDAIERHTERLSQKLNITPAEARLRVLRRMKIAKA